MYTLSVLVLLMLSITSLQAKTCEVLKKTNGCSIPFGLPFPFKKDFTGACNKHDVCYECVSRICAFIVCFSDDNPYLL